MNNKLRKMAALAKIWEHNMHALLIVTRGLEGDVLAAALKSLNSLMLRYADGLMSDPPLPPKERLVALKTLLNFVVDATTKDTFLRAFGNELSRANTAFDMYPPNILVREGETMLIWSIRIARM